MNRLVIHSQAESFIRTLAPEPRTRLVRALKVLPAGEVKALEGRLSGYFRLRVGGYRLIFADTVKNGVRTLDCLFVERRSIVYELFEQILAERVVQ